MQISNGFRLRAAILTTCLSWLSFKATFAQPNVVEPLGKTGVTYRAPVAEEEQKARQRLLGRVVNFHLIDTSPDDELLAVAQAAGINLLADASRFSTEPSRVQSQLTGNDEWALTTLLNEIGSYRRLAWQTWGRGRAVLFNDEPPLTELRRRLLAGEEPTRSQVQWDETTFEQRLLDFLRQRHGWTEDRPDFDLALPIIELPSELQHEARARAQSAALQNSSLPLLRAASGDDGLQDATLHIAAQDGVQPPRTVLTLNLVQNNRFLERVIDEWPHTPRGINADAGQTADHRLLPEVLSIDTTLAPFDWDAALNNAALRGSAPLLDDAALAADTDLQIPLKGEIRRQTLSEVVAEWSRQSKVALQVPENSSFATQLLTAHIANLSLLEAMQAVSHLFGAGWTREEDSYVLRPGERNALEVLLGRMGSTSTNVWEARGPAIDWWNDIVPVVGAEKLKSPGGVAARDLPDGVRERLRSIQDINVLSAVGVLNDTTSTAMRNLMLHLTTYKVSVFNPQTKEDVTQAQPPALVVEWHNGTGFPLLERILNKAAINP